MDIGHFLSPLKNALEAIPAQLGIPYRWEQSFVVGGGQPLNGVLPIPADGLITRIAWFAVNTTVPATEVISFAVQSIGLGARMLYQSAGTVPSGRITTSTGITMDAGFPFPFLRGLRVKQGEAFAVTGLATGNDETRITFAFEQYLTPIR